MSLTFRRKLNPRPPSFGLGPQSFCFRGPACFWPKNVSLYPWNAKPTTTSLNINTLKSGNTQISNFQTMKTAERYEILFKIWPLS